MIAPARPIKDATVLSKNSLDVGSVVRQLAACCKGARLVTFGNLEEDERRNRIFNKILGF